MYRPLSQKIFEREKQSTPQAQEKVPQKQPQDEPNQKFKIDPLIQERIALLSRSKKTGPSHLSRNTDNTKKYKVREGILYNQRNEKHTEMNKTVDFTLNNPSKALKAVQTSNGCTRLTKSDGKRNKEINQHEIQTQKIPAVSQKLAQIYDIGFKLTHFGILESTKDMIWKGENQQTTRDFGKSLQEDDEIYMKYYKEEKQCYTGNKKKDISVAKQLADRIEWQQKLLRGINFCQEIESQHGSYVKNLPNLDEAVFSNSHKIKSRAMKTLKELEDQMKEIKETKFCNQCFEDKNQWMHLFCCQKISEVCKDCVIDHIEAKIKQNQIHVKCQDCDQLMDQDQMLLCGISQQSKTTYLKLERAEFQTKFKDLLKKDEKLIFCPDVRCMNTCVTMNIKQYKEWKCGSCNKEVCVKCCLTHKQNEPCPLDTQEALEKNAKHLRAMGVQPCPKCGMHVQRNGQCYRMTCKSTQCRGKDIHFCAVCGEDITKVSYGHFQNFEMFNPRACPNYDYYKV